LSGIQAHDPSIQAAKTHALGRAVTVVLSPIHFEYSRKTVQKANALSALLSNFDLKYTNSSDKGK
jgi:hypothetical protein